MFRSSKEKRRGGSVERFPDAGGGGATGGHEELGPDTVQTGVELEVQEKAETGRGSELAGKDRDGLE